jgi:hypothetical protein
VEKEKTPTHTHTVSRENDGRLRWQCLEMSERSGRLFAGCQKRLQSVGGLVDKSYSVGGLVDKSYSVSGLVDRKVTVWVSWLTKVNVWVGWLTRVTVWVGWLTKKWKRSGCETLTYGVTGLYRAGLSVIKSG